MAYKKEELFEQAKKAIEDNPLFFIEDIVAFLPCTKSTFYKHFPLESDEINELKELLSMNKIQTKVGIRAKLFKENTGGLLALYRLICDPDERRMLNQQYIDHTTKNEKIEMPLTPQQVKEIGKKLDEDY